MEHLVLTLGILIGGAAALAIFFKLVRQSQIIAFIVVGLTAGILQKQLHIEQLHVSDEMVEVFSEIGIILLLFMAGLEVDFKSLRKRWKLVLGNGLGQIFVTCLLSTGLGALLLGSGKPLITLIYFGLCLTFSSTIVVISYLKNKKEMESLHGQVVLGLMVLQDICAVGAIVVLSSFKGGGDTSLGVAMAVVGLKLVVLCLCMVLLARYLLGRLFLFLARSKELLFLGSLGWVLGVAGLCEAFHFSPEIGAFVAGAALSFLPYRLEVQDKVEPMKDFGVILFFIALGYRLEIGANAVPLIPPILICSLFVLVGTPALMLLIGFFGRSKSRPSFMIGAIINQISEFSLILATLCLGVKVAGRPIFDQDTFLLITLSTVATIFVSSLGHEFIQQLYRKLRRPLEFIDSHSKKVHEAELAFELEDHVVIINFNELAEPAIERFIAAGRRVLFIDIDPDVHSILEEKHQERVHNGQFQCMYADFFDPDTWEEAGFAEARVIVSCLVGGQEAELEVLRWLKEERAAREEAESEKPEPERRPVRKVALIATTDSDREALELYQHGAMYVIKTEDLAAQRLDQLLAEYSGQMDQLAVLGGEHRRRLEKRAQEERTTFDLK